MSEKKILIWDYFMEIDANYAMCKICKNIYSRPGLSPLRRHLLVKHPEKYEEYCQLNKNDKPNGLKQIKEEAVATNADIKEEINVATTSATTAATKITDEQNLQKTLKKLFKNKTKNDSLIWNYFKELDADFAMCNICKNIYTRRGQNTNDLKKHLNSTHPDKFEEYTKQELEADESDSSDSTEAAASPENIDANSKRSLVWKYFKEHDKCAAFCKICNKVRRRGGNTSSLRVHLKRVHPKQYKELCEEEGEDKSDDLSAIKPKRSKRTKSEVIYTNDSSEEEHIEPRIPIEKASKTTDPLVPSSQDLRDFGKVKKNFRYLKKIM